MVMDHIIMSMIRLRRRNMVSFISEITRLVCVQNGQNYSRICVLTLR